MTRTISSPSPARRRLRGFTLIELITVVIIIGILAAIAAVAFGSFVGDSRDTAAHADAAQLRSAIAAASAQHDRPAQQEIMSALDGVDTADPAAVNTALHKAFSMTSDSTLTLDSPSAPTKVTVTLGHHSSCLAVPATNDGTADITACDASGAVTGGGTNEGANAGGAPAQAPAASGPSATIGAVNGDGDSPVTLSGLDSSKGYVVEWHNSDYAIEIWGGLAPGRTTMLIPCRDAGGRVYHGSLSVNLSVDSDGMGMPGTPSTQVGTLNCP